MTGPSSCVVVVLVAVGLLAPISASANGTASNRQASPEQTRAEYHAAQDAGVDAAVDAIVRELAAVGTGPQDARRANPSADPATKTLPGADEGGDDHAM